MQQRKCSETHSRASENATPVCLWSVICGICVIVCFGCNGGVQAKITEIKNKLDRNTEKMKKNNDDLNAFNRSQENAGLSATEQLAQTRPYGERLKQLEDEREQLEQELEDLSRPQPLFSIELSKLRSAVAYVLVVLCTVLTVFVVCRQSTRS